MPSLAVGLGPRRESLVNKSTLSQLLIRNLGSGYVVVAGPDHPDLLVGPDILIGGGGRLTALFCISKATRRRVLQARVVAARLALPASARFIAFVEPDANPSENLARNGFDDVLGTFQTNDLERLCAMPKPDSHQVHEIKSVQRRHAAFYSAVLQIIELRSRHELIPTNSRELINRLNISDELPNSQESSSGDRIRGARATVDQTTVAALSGPQSPTSSRLISVWSEALSGDFALDMGVPYFGRLQPRVLLVESWPRHRYDPLKPVRAAAFSGWLMAIATTPDDIRALVRRSIRAIARRTT